MQNSDWKNRLKKNSDWEDKLGSRFQFKNVLHMMTKDFIKSNKNFIKWAAENDIKGSGTSEDPFVIDSIPDLPKEFQASNLGLHIIIQDHDFHEVYLRKCQNLQFRECKFGKLILVKCSEIALVESSIVIINLIETRNISFKASNISTYLVNNIPFKGDLTQIRDNNAIVKAPLKKRLINVSFCLIAIVGFALVILYMISIIFSL
jgi:hypothetical protein